MTNQDSSKHSRSKYYLNQFVPWKPKHLLELNYNTTNSRSLQAMVADKVTYGNDATTRLLILKCIKATIVTDTLLNNMLAS